MNIKQSKIFMVFLMVISSVLYTQQQFVTPKKKRPSQKMLKEDIAGQWEQFLLVSADHIVLCGQMQRRLLTKREAVERFVGKADSAILHDHHSRLENLNNQLAAFQKNMVEEFKKLEADVEKFCII